MKKITFAEIPMTLFASVFVTAPALVLAPVLVLIFTLLLPHTSSAFGLNDVSVLLPLPRDAREYQYTLSPFDNGLIPSAILQQLPPLVINEDDPAPRLSQLRLVAVRFDPCFVEGNPPFRCRRQIRLVFQPTLIYQGRGMTVDAAVHAFYDFDDAGWTEVMREWLPFVSDTPVTPLQVHPTIKREGLAGPHWLHLRALLLRYCGIHNLTRVTESTVNIMSSVWVFRGFDVVRGRMQPIAIADTNGHNAQAFVTDISQLQEFISQIAPAPVSEPAWMSFIGNSVKARHSASRDQLLTVFSRAVEFENPQKFNPGTRDCVSCHVAQTVRLWGEQNIPGAATDPLVNQVRYGSVFPLENRSLHAFNSNRVRAFGYFLDEPILSQRVINESAAVATMMSQAGF